MSLRDCHKQVGTFIGNYEEWLSNYIVKNLHNGFEFRMFWNVQIGIDYNENLLFFIAGEMG